MTYRSLKQLSRPAFYGGLSLPRPTKTSQLLAALGLVCLLAFVPLSAAELSIVPMLDLGGVYESNARLSRNTSDEAEGVSADGKMQISFRTARSTIDFRPRLLAEFYADKNDQDLEEEDYYLPLTLSTRTQKSATNARLGYNDVSIRRSEVNTAGDNESGGSADLNVIEDRQRRFYFSPGWSYALSPRVNLRLDGSYSDISYRRGTQSRRFDYEYYSASASIERVFTAKINIGIAVNGSDFDAIEPLSGQTNQSTGYGTDLFMTYQLNETLGGSLSIGAHKTRGESELQPNAFGNCSSFIELLFGNIRDCLTKYSSDEITGRLQLTKTSEQTNYKLKLDRIVSPNSNGAETVRDTLSVTANHRFQANVTATLGLLYYQQEIAATLFPVKQDYFNGSLSLRWHFSPHWSLRATYAYTWVEDRFLGLEPATIEADARNNYVFLGIGWRGLGWRF